MKKLKKLFKMQSFTRNRGSSELLPLFQPSTSRNRSPSIDSISTNSSSSSSHQRQPRSYGSFLPNYFAKLRNTLRRSTSSQVRIHIGYISIKISAMVLPN